MNHDEHETHRNGKLKFKANWVLVGFLAIAGFFLIAEHKAHLLGWLPFILLALCPLLHIFGHGGHDHSQNKEDKS